MNNIYEIVVGRIEHTENAPTYMDFSDHHDMMHEYKYS